MPRAAQPRLPALLGSLDLDTQLLKLLEREIVLTVKLCRDNGDEEMTAVWGKLMGYLSRCLEIAREHGTADNEILERMVRKVKEMGAEESVYLRLAPEEQRERVVRHTYQGLKRLYSEKGQHDMAEVVSEKLRGLQNGHAPGLVVSSPGTPGLSEKQPVTPLMDDTAPPPPPPPVKQAPSPQVNLDTTPPEASMNSMPQPPPVVQHQPPPAHQSTTDQQDDDDEEGMTDEEVAERLAAILREIKKPAKVEVLRKTWERNKADPEKMAEKMCKQHASHKEKFDWLRTVKPKAAKPPKAATPPIPPTSKVPGLNVPGRETPTPTPTPTGGGTPSGTPTPTNNKEGKEDKKKPETPTSGRPSTPRRVSNAISGALKRGLVGIVGTFVKPPDDDDFPQAILPDSNEEKDMFYDENLGRWVFPGQTEVNNAPPPPPPPPASTTTTKAKPVSRYVNAFNDGGDDDDEDDTPAPPSIPPPPKATH